MSYDLSREFPFYDEDDSFFDSHPPLYYDYDDYDDHDDFDDFSFTFSNYNNNTNNVSPFSLNSFLTSLPVVKNPNSNCSICMEEFGTTRLVVELPCKHCFDMDCIGEWIKRSSTCPMCRSKLNLDGANSNDEKFEFSEMLEWIREWEPDSSSLSLSATAMYDEDGDTLMVDAV